jgi:hypothetical protein
LIFKVVKPERKSKMAKKLKKNGVTLHPRKNRHTKRLPFVRKGQPDEFYDDSKPIPEVMEPPVVELDSKGRFFFA